MKPESNYKLREEPGAETTQMETKIEKSREEMELGREGKQQTRESNITKNETKMEKSREQTARTKKLKVLMGRQITRLRSRTKTRETPTTARAEGLETRASKRVVPRDQR